MADLITFLPPIVGAIVGILLKSVYDIIVARRRFRKELEDNEHIDVTGEWCVAWQTSVDGEQLLNTEDVILKQKGKTVRIWNAAKSVENPIGGFLWEGQLQFFQGRSLMGWYAAKKEENNTSKGIMYFTFLSQKKMFYGKWVGAAYDGELLAGFSVIAKDRTTAKSVLAAFIHRHPQEVRLIAYDGLR